MVDRPKDLDLVEVERPVRVGSASANKIQLGYCENCLEGVKETKKSSEGKLIYETPPNFRKRRNGENPCLAAKGHEMKARSSMKFNNKVVEIMSTGKTSPNTTTTNDSGCTTTDWFPSMDSIIETPKTEEERKEIDEHINNTLYGSGRITPRLPVFEEICPSTNGNERWEEKTD
ncbi:hypothetical protein Q3G72_005076 [Acer saccharum]|nr:hypothetical protein Q3G72_005076 [Acer saccharum]